MVRAAMQTATPTATLHVGCAALPRRRTQVDRGARQRDKRRRVGLVGRVLLCLHVASEWEQRSSMCTAVPLQDAVVADRALGDGGWIPAFGVRGPPP